MVSVAARGGALGRTSSGAVPAYSSPIRFARILCQGEGGRRMVANKHLGAKRQPGAEPNPDASAIFGTMVEAGAGCYVRARDLPRLIALWPHELCDQTSEGSLLILSKLRRALRAERRRALAGHWSYELNRHLGLMTAYKAELGLMRRAKLRLRRTAPGVARSTSAAAETPKQDGKPARRPGEPSR